MSPFSLVVEHQSCKLEVASSILAEGYGEIYGEKFRKLLHKGCRNLRKNSYLNIPLISRYVTHFSIIIAGTIWV